MTKWAKSLIRISGYEVETLQKRLADITTRRAAAEMRLAVLDAEMEVERERAAVDAQQAMAMTAYTQGWKLRRSIAESELSVIAAEEEGARDALAAAFEDLKKFEQVAEATRLSVIAAENQRESAQLDELALRRKAL